jgi:hypothetical protein
MRCFEDKLLFMAAEEGRNAPFARHVRAARLRGLAWAAEILSMFMGWVNSS